MVSGSARPGAFRFRSGRPLVYIPRRYSLYLTRLQRDSPVRPVSRQTALCVRPPRAPNSTQDAFSMPATDAVDDILNSAPLALTMDGGARRTCQQCGKHFKF